MALLTLPVARSIGSSPAELFFPPQRLLHRYSVSADLVAQRDGKALGPAVKAAVGHKRPQGRVKAHRSTPSSYSTFTLSTLPSRHGPSRVSLLIAHGAGPPRSPGLAAAGGAVPGTNEDHDDQTVAPTSPSRETGV